VSPRILVALVVGAFFVTAACNDAARLTSAPSEHPSFSLAPGDGNGRKVDIPIDVEFTDAVACQNGASLDLHLTGWAQVQVFDRPNIFLVHQIHIDFTFSNAAGQTFVWRERGTDLITVDENGDLIVHSTGRDGFDGIIGRIVTDLATGEVSFEKGNLAGTSNDQACAALS
jgi:hypothetical protein